MAYIRSNAGYYHSIGRPDLAEKEEVLDHNSRCHPSDRLPIPGNYVGYKGTVDQQPDNPCAPTDDDD